MRLRNVMVVLGVLAGAVLLCGGLLALDARHDEQERRQNDRVVRAYLDALVRGAYPAAHRFVCGDATVDRDGFEWTEGGDQVTSFEIEYAGDWSSIDGHGSSYRVHLSRVSGARDVETIWVEDDSDTICITDTLITPE